MWKRVVLFSIVPVILLCTAAYMYRHDPVRAATADEIILLVPDGTAKSDLIVREWLDAADEEGIHLAVMNDSEFLNPMRQTRPVPGVIIPDLIHRVANGSLVGALHTFVENGGNLMFVYDACTWDLARHYSPVRSRLSDLAGASYAMYDRYETDSIHWGPVWGDPSLMSALEIPPGKYLAPHSRALGADPVDHSNPADARPSSQQAILTRYQYGDLEYPVFRTSGTFNGKVLLQSGAGLAAGYSSFGLGHVLFVNLPLGYLEARTDGLLLHAFLHYYAVEVLGFPYLAAVPGGVGGLVFNWHIDAKSSIRPMNELFSAGVFDQAPYSIHFTAGPDVDASGDGKGLNLETDAESQRLLSQMLAKHHEIGSHGGWIHNYFGENVTANNEQQFADLIERNVDVLEQRSGRRINVYSAPLGNHPLWMTRWLERHHFIAYYFVGDAGMAPTQVFRDDTRDGDSIWAFPIAHLGKYASLEEMGFDSLPAESVRQWLISMSDFAADDHSARLIYTHPLGATKYVGALKAFLQHTSQLASSRRFRWYSMGDLANFLNRRKTVAWIVSEPSGHRLVLHAKAPGSLQDQTWVFPQKIFGKPRIVKGKGEVRSDGNVWLVSAADCTDLQMEVDRL